MACERTNIRAPQITDPRWLPCYPDRTVRTRIDERRPNLPAGYAAGRHRLSDQLSNYGFTALYLSLHVGAQSPRSVFRWSDLPPATSLSGAAFVVSVLVSVATVRDRPAKPSATGPQSGHKHRSLRVSCGHS
jgi:hypothetical protein